MPVSRPGCAVASSCQAANFSESILTRESSIKIYIMNGFKHYLSFISCIFVIDAILCFWLMRVIFLSAGIEKGIKYSQDLDQSSIMLLFEHNLRSYAINAS